MKKTNFKIKLILLCLFMSLVSLVIGSVSYLGFQHFTELSSEISHSVIPRSTLLSEMDVNYQKTRIAVRTLGLENLTRKDREQAIADSLKAVAAYESAADNLDKKVVNSVERELFSSVKREWNDFKAVGIDAINFAKIYDEASRSKLLEIFLVHCPAAASKYQISLNKYRDHINTEVIS